MRLENKEIILDLTEKGGEMTALTLKSNNVQYLWQGDDAFWSGKNPSLFPQVGNTYTNSYEINGKTYAMKNHGFIRNSELTCISSNEYSATFQLLSNDDTLAVYPFAFDYRITYTIEGSKVKISYDIKNIGDSAMPFGFGLHPGFNCPLEQDETFSDYSIVFDHEEQLEQIHFDPNKETPHYSTSLTIKDLPLRYKTIMDAATLIYKGMKSEYVTLQGPKHAVRLSIQPFPLFAIWTPSENAPFVCLEPWYSHGDFEKVDVPFEKRDGTIILKPNDTFHTSYSIEVLS
ncbi:MULTISPECIES: aldose 1-epimerase family protein [unclassified Breznakia]|uniref:aldose 1-epimerase family protein n=1 Tax=unclassified Breznakia TaxID=2623764 RepID=UPI0024739B0A|nr:MULTISPECIES: aldose 1-epimerase family protein [unclassified Breznakia]MDH6367744.1 galactose mutarotase-like enzyme [Breznakia sp. PH1-1]MDH6404832.1 galactose mutarotase-like enzyme [Breznakia sp. PF1-11]MDH6412542.1 galactose mutarotase-like enzyme [Breznakia sp. PFB1-11]MDH6414907.1 galactose mutarotase-like enzyme [Breznakia sp. PFB1-14]MDH6417213.1 galactose mutarotase-like enzyme [Breznakia sp. PFB1-4]